jgi:hypothetical protein
MIGGNMIKFWFLLLLYHLPESTDGLGAGQFYLEGLIRFIALDPTKEAKLGFMYRLWLESGC